MPTGTVKWFNTRKGYGFITTDDVDGDVFVHYSNITGTDGEFKNLNEEDEVEFEITQGQKGPEATDVRITKAAPRKSRGGGRGGGYSDW